MEHNRLQIKIKKLRLKTPLMTASGTSGTSDELTHLREEEKVLESIGAFITKGVTLEPRKGNPDIRIVENRISIINSIGLQNSGAKKFLKCELPCLLQYELPIIVNISASTVQEFGRLAGYLIENDINRIIAGLELNVSCPNISEGGLAFGTNPKLVERIVKKVKNIIGNKAFVITKLTPNVTDITVPAKAAIAGGTDAISLINTIRGASINIKTKKPYLRNVHGGISGPAIKPVGIFMVYECFKKISECRKKRIHIIGVGGICTWKDALEYIMAGATAVQIGTAWLVNSMVFFEIKIGIEKYLMDENTTIKNLVGISHGR